MLALILLCLLEVVYIQAQSCHKVCTAQYQPVCGSDHKTYSNMCQLQVAECYAKQKGQRLTLSHAGRCGVQVTQRPHTTYSCMDVCDEELDLVCGSDGNTYHNRCFLNLASCEARKTGHHLYATHSGDCTDKEANCPHECDNVLEPVCSSGNITFKNMCTLTMYACKYADSLHASDRYHFQHNGTCDGTDPYMTSKIDCSGFISPSSIAIEGSIGLQFNCPSMEHSSLCGADHRTYMGPCSYCRSMSYRHKLDANHMVDVVSESACPIMIG